VPIHRHAEGTSAVPISEMRGFSQGQGQFRRTAELDRLQAAQRAEGHGRPESNQGIVRKITESTPHKGSRRLTLRLRKRAISECELAKALLMDSLIVKHILKAKGQGLIGPALFLITPLSCRLRRGASRTIQCLSQSIDALDVSSLNWDSTQAIFVPIGFPNWYSHRPSV
jgi:hypothetical protein